MKIRMGFVSNSSTSSFLIYGVELDMDEIVKNIEDQKEFVLKAQKIIKENSKDYPRRIEYANECVDEIVNNVNGKYIDETLKDLIECYILSVGLELYSDDYDDEFVGISVTRIKDDETFGEFKNNIRNKINDIFSDKFIDKNFHLIERAWYNG